MLENSRKRARKSKLEVREGVELEEATVLYMEKIETKIKDEPMIDIGPTKLLSTSKLFRDPFDDVNDAAMPTIDHKPKMEFSVKIEVEEFDEAEMKEIQERNNQIEANNVTIPENNYSKGSNCATTSGVQEIKSTISKAKNVKEIITGTKQTVSSKEFKEYITNRLKILKVTERLVKSDQAVDRILAIGVRNYVGRILEEPFKELRDVLLCKALEDWEVWYLEHSAVRDIPLIYKCYICGKAWWYFYDFREHILSHTKLKNFEVSLESNNDECCLICFQLDIIYNDVELPETSCDRCEKAAESHEFVDNEPYMCLGCKTTFSTCTQLKLHENKCPQFKNQFFPDATEVHKCSICIYECPTEKSLSDHMIRRHSVRSDAVITWDVKKCSVCSRSYILMALHICVRKTNNYGCNYCGRSFQKKVYKEIHMASCEKETECRLCDKPLLARCMEHSHMLQHTDRYALMYKCIQCIEGRYYPDEFSIEYHTKIVHNRPFEKKFKYLEMVILPKQCLEKSSKTAKVATAKVATAKNSAKTKNGLAKEIANSKIFVPSTKFRSTHKQTELPLDVVVKQEPEQDVDIDTLCVSDLSSIKTGAVDETSPHIKISDITSLQDLMTLKTEPGAELDGEDLIIIEDKAPQIDLYSSDSDDYRMKTGGAKKKKQKRITCICGYMDIRSRIAAHKLGCIATQARRAAAGGGGGNDDKSDLSDNSDDDNLEIDDENLPHVSDEEWKQGAPLKKKGKGGLRYTCHCKKVFTGTLAAFRRHKKACVVVSKLKKQTKDAKRIAEYTCTKCGTAFNSLLRYCKHLNRVHYFQKNVCPQCLFMADNLMKLTSHVTMHVSRSCQKIRVISETQEWSKCNKCKICKKPVERKDFFKHWESHLILKPGDTTRGRDSDGVPEEGQFIMHQTPPARDQAAPVYGAEVLQRALVWLQAPSGRGAVDEKTCVFCARRFARKNDSKRHVIEHLLQDAYAHRPEYRALRCQICGIGFPKDDKFKHHMREHAGLPVYQCNLCGKSFSDSSNFCKHRKVHGLSLMRCSVCEKLFHNSNHLERHMEMHEKTKPIVCNTCGKVFFTASAHKKHVRIVHERHKSRVLCQVCRASFTRLKDKWDHMWLVHKERKFNADCPLCTSSFRRFADVKTHVRVVHNKSVRLGTDQRMVVY